MNNKDINLSKHMTNKTNVLVGKKYGKFVNKEAFVEEFAEEYDHITFILPDRCWAVNPSFIIGLLDNLLERPLLYLGEYDNIKDKVSFKHNNKIIQKNIQKNYNEVISRWEIKPKPYPQKEKRNFFSKIINKIAGKPERVGW